MSKVTYAQARADHEYLWAICPAKDMTGGYVDQNDLALLLKSPTPTTARGCYISQIEHWFQAGPEDGGYRERDRLIASDPRVKEIYERYM